MQDKKRPKIISLLEHRNKQGLDNELGLTYTICEEIDHLHDRLDRQAEVINGLIALVKILTPPEPIKNPEEV